MEPKSQGRIYHFILPKALRCCCSSRSRRNTNKKQKQKSAQVKKRRSVTKSGSSGVDYRACDGSERQSMELERRSCGWWPFQKANIRKPYQNPIETIVKTLFKPMKTLLKPY